MEYNHIKNYLEKFKEILFSKEEKYKIISDIIKKNTSIEIETKFIKIYGDTIQIKTSPIIKNEILINKDKILKDLFQIAPNYNIKNIK